LCTDLREDKHYLLDHPGAVPVTTAQVLFLVPMPTAEDWRIAAAGLCHNFSNFEIQMPLISIL